MSGQIFLLLVLALTSQVWCKGTLRMRFVRYENPNGLDENGECCDKVFRCISNGCDHAFKVCLDDISRARQTKTEAKECRFGFYATEESKDRNTVIFGTKIGKTNNPLNFTFAGPIPQQMALRVLVEDEDSGKDDKVELLKDVVTIQPSNVASGREWSLMVQNRTKLQLGISVQCDPGYSGADCNRKCRPPSPRDHYSCNPVTGAMTCHPGWAGPNCNQKAEECSPGYCEYGVRCVVMNGRKACRCPPVLSGDRCQYHSCHQRCADSRGGECVIRNRYSPDYYCRCGRGHHTVDSPNGQFCQ